MRVIVQYSLNYGAVTAVTLEQGASLLDDQYDALVSRLDPTRAYYGIDLSFYEDAEGDPGPIGLGGEGIQVKGYDRQLKMLDIGLQVTGKVVDFKTPGTSIEDQGGFKKQLRGERWEFVPAHEVKLLGKETALTFYVAEQRLGNGEEGCKDAAGCLVQSVAAASESYFKTPIELCEGLPLRFGDDVRAAIEEWTLLNGAAAARQCEIVFNYSANGNVLFSVTSLVNKISFSTSDGRATAVTLWQ